MGSTKGFREFEEKIELDSIFTHLYIVSIHEKGSLEHFCTCF